MFAFGVISHAVSNYIGRKILWEILMRIVKVTIFNISYGVEWKISYVFCRVVDLGFRLKFVVIFEGIQYILFLYSL